MEFRLREKEKQQEILSESLASREDIITAKENNLGVREGDQRRPRGHGQPTGVALQRCRTPTPWKIWKNAQK